MATGKLTESTLAIVVACVITAVWVISFIVDLKVKAYDPPNGVQALMMLVAGWLFGGPAIRSLRGDKVPTKEDDNDGTR